jgi:hypothetical protein
MSGAASAFRWFFNQWFKLYNWVVPVVPLPSPLAADNCHYPAAATAAVVTYAAVAKRRHVISGVHFGYSETPASGAVLKIEVNSVILYQLPITAGGAGPINFPEPIMGGENQEMKITLTSGGGTSVAYLNVLGKTYDGQAPSATQGA